MYWRFKRLEIGFIKGSPNWGVDRGCGAGCTILSFGRVFITWLGKLCADV